MAEQGRVVMMVKGKVMCVGLWKYESGNKTAQVASPARWIAFGIFHNTDTEGILRFDNGGYTCNSWTWRCSPGCIKQVKKPGLRVPPRARALEPESSVRDVISKP